MCIFSAKGYFDRVSAGSYAKSPDDKYYLSSLASAKMLTAEVRKLSGFGKFKIICILKYIKLL